MWDDKWTGKTIGAALDEAAERYGDKVATVFQNGEVTYNQLKQTADLVARGFLSLGIGKGDKVAIWMAGYAEWAYVYFALARIGAIMVPVNTRYRPEEVEYVLNKSKASILILKEEPNKDYLSLLKELSPGAGEAADAIPNEKLPYLRKIVVSSQRSLLGCMSFDDLKNLGAGVSEATLNQAAAQSNVRRHRDDPIHLRHHRHAQRRNALSRRDAAGCVLRQPGAQAHRSGPFLQSPTFLPCRRLHQSHAGPHRLRLHDDRPALL